MFNYFPLCQGFYLLIILHHFVTFFFFLAWILFILSIFLFLFRLPVFNLHADALQITLPSSTSSSRTPSSFSSFSSSFSTSIGLTSISGSVSLLEPQQTVTLSFSFYLPQRVFTGCRGKLSSSILLYSHFEVSFIIFFVCGFFSIRPSF